MINKTALSLLTTIIFILCWNSYVLANTNKGDAIIVRGVMPQNQISQNQSTFDLLVKPSSQQILVVKITNITNQAQTFNTAVTSAKTNINGDAEYVPSNNKLDKSAPFDMSKIARLPKILEIPANSTKQLTIKLDSPDKGWDAVVAGGLSVIQSKAIDIKTEKNLV